MATEGPIPSESRVEVACLFSFNKELVLACVINTDRAARIQSKASKQARGLRWVGRGMPWRVACGAAAASGEGGTRMTDGQTNRHHVRQRHPPLNV